MSRHITYRWQLRQLMAARGMFATTDLLEPLAERGVTLSAAQVYRLVTGTPERLNLHTLAALCDILGVAPGELIEPVAEDRAGRKRKIAGRPRPIGAEPDFRPVRARIVADDDQ